MSRIQNGQTTSRVEELVSELKAIELWDAVYQRNLSSFWFDRMAFVSRQKRRAEISSELQCINDASRPVPSTGLSQSQSEETVREVRERRPPQSSHDRSRNERNRTG